MGIAKMSVAALGLAGGASAALQPIVMKGQKFFYENGTQFFMKGIAYQEGIGQAGVAIDTKNSDYMDPLADETKCKRDVPHLKELGINTIRTYAIDPKQDHDACMKLLDDAGIYVISDLSQPMESINRDQPTWDYPLLDRYTSVVKALADYGNVIGFFAGNEVSNSVNNTQASAFVKAAVRDTKAYIKKNHNKRWIGVGYATNDDTDIRVEMAEYFNCGEADTTIDYWGYNIYSWCSPSTYETSGYEAQTEFFSNFSIPVFFAEYGCNTGPKGAESRDWSEAGALYGKEMSKVFSGGIAYMYFEEKNDFGVVKTNSKGGVDEMTNYAKLAAAHAKAKPEGVSMSSYKPANDAASKCPAVSDTWKVSSKALPPTPDKDLCDCMVKSRECVPVDDLSPKDYGDHFGYICGDSRELCTAVNGYPETDAYGAYSMCAPAQRLAYLMDAYYQKYGKKSDKCDFSGAAKIQKASKTDQCSAALKKADATNKEVADIAPPSDSGSDSGSGSGSKGDGKGDGKGGDEGFGLRSASAGLPMVLAVGAGAVMALL